MAEEQVELPPYKLAFILDGEVVDILHTDERLAAIFTSNPIIEDVTDLLNKDPQSVSIGMKYNDVSKEFIKE